jgi:ribonuclease Z
LTFSFINDIIRKNYIVEDYTKKIITISGDSLPISPDIIEDSEILLHECTFIKESDRKLRNHTSLDEIKELLKQISPKKVILYHVCFIMGNNI